MPQTTLIYPFALPGRNKSEPKGPRNMVVDGPAPTTPGILPARPALAVDAVGDYLDFPAIAGTTVVGQTLNCSRGTWDSEPNETSFSYAWTRNGVVVQFDSPSPLYTLQAGDIGAMIACRVLATMRRGGSGVAFANPVGPITETRAVESGPVAALPEPLALAPAIEPEPVAAPTKPKAKRRAR